MSLPHQAFKVAIRLSFMRIQNKCLMSAKRRINPYIQNFRYGLKKEKLKNVMDKLRQRCETIPFRTVEFLNSHSLCYNER